MFRKLAIAVITAVVALLETVADAITATLPPPAADSPRLRVVTPGRLCLGCASYHSFRANIGHIGEAISQARAGADEALRRAAADANAAASAAETRIADTGQQELRSALRPELAYSPGRRARSPDRTREAVLQFAPVGDGRPRRKPPRPQPRAPEGWHWLPATTECHDLAGLRPPPGRSRTSRPRALGTTSLLIQDGPPGEWRRQQRGHDSQNRYTELPVRRGLGDNADGPGSGAACRWWRSPCVGISAVPVPGVPGSPGARVYDKYMEGPSGVDGRCMGPAMPVVCLSNPGAREDLAGWSPRRCSRCP